MNAQLSLFEAGERRDAWTVRTSRRARRLSVRVYPGGRVEIVTPPGASPGIVQRFIGQHREWIDRRVREFAAHAHVHLDAVLPNRIVLPTLARSFAVEYADRDAAPRIVGDGERVLVVGSRIEPRAVAHCLRRWLMELAAVELDARLRTLAEQFGFSFARTQIRRQRTRWGSCSISGTISLNVCLLFLEPAVSRYLLIHELCHTRHMNHSPRFWELVERCEPDFQRLDRELTRAWRCVPWWMFG